MPAGVMQTIKVAHFRLTFSRQMFVVAYPRETQEMVFDAHNRAFAFFGGVLSMAAWIRVYLAHGRFGGERASC
jgi:hypothetical protein